MWSAGRGLGFEREPAIGRDGLDVTSPRGEEPASRGPGRSWALGVAGAQRMRARAVPGLPCALSACQAGPLERGARGGRGYPKDGWQRLAWASGASGWVSVCLSVPSGSPRAPREPGGPWHVGRTAPAKGGPFLSLVI